MRSPEDIARGFDWQAHRKFLQKTRFRPMYDRAFERVSREKMAHCFDSGKAVKPAFLEKFDRWVHGSSHNTVKGLGAFPHRDFIQGVTHALDDLHVTYGERLVGMEGEYPYHRRMKPAFVQRTLQTLAKGDTLVLAIPFAWYGAEHPETALILDRCRELSVPVHVDSAWYGCLRGFHFDFDHPAIESVSFSLSKSLGLGSQRVGVRYARERRPGPVTIINDFAMEVTAVMHAAIVMIDEFGSDYLQNRYGGAYELVCRNLDLLPTKALHLAFEQEGGRPAYPVGIRPFLRYLVDDHDEFR